MQKIRDGDVYKTLIINGSIFEIRYGYYEEFERESCDPVPIYPDFLRDPMYDKDGYPFATAMQDVCDRFEGGCGELGCWGCRHYRAMDDLVGICTNAFNKKRI